MVVPATHLLKGMGGDVRATSHAAAVSVFGYFFFRTPLVYLFVAGSFLYHDHVWYPIFGKKVVGEFAKRSKWGRLFESYPEAPRERSPAELKKAG